MTVSTPLGSVNARKSGTTYPKTFIVCGCPVGEDHPKYRRMTFVRSTTECREEAARDIDEESRTATRIPAVLTILGSPGLGSRCRTRARSPCCSGPAAASGGGKHVTVKAVWWASLEAVRKDQCAMLSDDGRNE